MKTFFLIIFLFYSSLISFSQNRTIEIENGKFFKIKSGYIIYGISDDAFVITKYDNQFNKITEYKKEVGSYKRKSPYFKNNINSYDFTFFAKGNGYLYYNLRLDTSLVVLESWKSSDFAIVPIYDEDDIIGIRETTTNIKEVGMFSDNEVTIDKNNKSISIKKKPTAQDANPKTFFTEDLRCKGKIDKYGFETINNKLYFYVKTITEELFNSSSADFLMPGRHFNSYREINSDEKWDAAKEEIEFNKVVGELYIGEIDIDKSNVKYFTKIPNEENDYSIKKILFDDKLDQLIITGEFLKIENYKSEKKKERSDQTGWYITSIDRAGRINNLRLYKSTDTIFDNIKSKLQINKSTSIQKIEKTKSGYIILANYLTSFFNNSYDGANTYASKVKQPFGFFIYEINDNFEIEKEDFYPIKQKDRFSDKIEDISNSNTVKGSLDGKEFYLAAISDNFNNLVYVYKNQIFTIKNRKNVAYIQDIMTQNGEKIPTYFCPLNNEKFYIVNIKPKNIIFELRSY